MYYSTISIILKKATKMVKTIDNLSDFKKQLTSAEDKLVVACFYWSWCKQYEYEKQRSEYKPNFSNIF